MHARCVSYSLFPFPRIAVAKPKFCNFQGVETRSIGSPAAKAGRPPSTLWDNCARQWPAMASSGTTESIFDFRNAHGGCFCCTFSGRYSGLFQPPEKGPQSYSFLRGVSPKGIKKLGSPGPFTVFRKKVFFPFIHKKGRGGRWRGGGGDPRFLPREY